jgi:type II secretion system protein N
MLKKICGRLAGCLGYLLYAVGLLGLLLWLLFPREPLHRLLVRFLNTSLPACSWQVQAIEWRIFEGVTLRAVEGYEPREEKKPLVRLDALTLRPDFVGMLRTRQMRVDYRLALARGTVNGSLQTTGDRKQVRFEGTLQGVQLAEMALVSRLLQRNMDGVIAATFDGIAQRDSMRIGEINGKVRIDNGRLELKRPILNHAVLPFSQATMALQLRGEMVKVEQGRIESALFSGQFEGAVELDQDMARSRVVVQGTILPRPEFFKGVDNPALLQVFRNRLKDDSLPFRVSGNLAEPGIHFEEYSLLFQSLEEELQ